MEHQNDKGEWTAGDIQRAPGRGRLLATVQTEMVVRRGSQKKAKRQRVTAEICYDLGITLEWEEVQLLARLGGWTFCKDRKPGKLVLTHGLQRLMNMLATQTFLNRYVADRSGLPPQIAALLRDFAAEDL